MTKKRQLEYYCSGCGKKATTANPMFSDRMCRLEFTVFHCHKCGLIYIDEYLIKAIIKHWNKGRNTEESIKSLYSEYLEKIENFVKANFIKKLGYRKAQILQKK